MSVFCKATKSHRDYAERMNKAKRQGRKVIDAAPVIKINPDGYKPQVKAASTISCDGDQAAINAYMMRTA